MGVDRSII